MSQNFIIVIFLKFDLVDSIIKLNFPFLIVELNLNYLLLQNHLITNNHFFKLQCCCWGKELILIPRFLN